MRPVHLITEYSRNRGVVVQLFTMCPFGSSYHRSQKCLACSVMALTRAESHGELMKGVYSIVGSQMIDMYGRGFPKSLLILTSMCGCRTKRHAIYIPLIICVAGTVSACQIARQARGWSANGRGHFDALAEGGKHTPSYFFLWIRFISIVRRVAHLTISLHCPENVSISIGGYS